MIGLLRGVLVDRTPDVAILDVGGVGYEVHAPGRTLDAWSQAEGEVTAIISTQVREDAIEKSTKKSLEFDEQLAEQSEEFEQKICALKEEARVEREKLKAVGMRNRLARRRRSRPAPPSWSSGACWSRSKRSSSA